MTNNSVFVSKVNKCVYIYIYTVFNTVGLDQAERP